MSDNKVYTVPAPIAAALGSGRGEMFAMLFNKEIDEGHVVPVEQVKEIIRLVGDLIEDNRRMKSTITGLEDMKYEMDELMEHIEDAKHKLDTIKGSLIEELEEAA